MGSQPQRAIHRRQGYDDRWKTGNRSGRRKCLNLTVGHDVRSAGSNDSLPRRLQIQAPPGRQTGPRLSSSHSMFGVRCSVLDVGCSAFLPSSPDSLARLPDLDWNKPFRPASYSMKWRADGMRAKLDHVHHRARSCRPTPTLHPARRLGRGAKIRALRPARAAVTRHS
jgi:hypothetical protein